jgi:hypothetical protein
MANLSQNPNDYQHLYDGFNIREVSAGLSQPGYYHSEEYRKSKIKHLVLGGISQTVYSGFEHDYSPLMLTMKQEPEYNTILAFNLHYIPIRYRQQIIKFVLETNRNRIQNNQPIMIDYHNLVRAIPEARGIVRRYKQMFIGVIGTPTLDKWPSVIRTPSRFENYYRYYMK